VFEILRALCAGEDVIARIVFARARLVVEGSTVDDLPHGVGRRRVDESRIVGKSVKMGGGRGGGCLPIPARLVEDELILDGALGRRSRRGHV
jgi:hypothetical protein